MLSPEDQALMTKVGPGTPCGDLLRRYWLPICPVAELTAKTPKKRVRMLGEDMLVFRDGKGRYGMVEAQCRHRKTQLYFGFVEDDGLRCAYHGWKYDVVGKCIEQPFEPANSPLKKEACHDHVSSHNQDVPAGCVHHAARDLHVATRLRGGNRAPLCAAVELRGSRLRTAGPR